MSEGVLRGGEGENVCRGVEGRGEWGRGERGKEVRVGEGSGGRSERGEGRGSQVSCARIILLFM